MSQSKFLNIKFNAGLVKAFRLKYLIVQKVGNKTFVSNTHVYDLHQNKQIEIKQVLTPLINIYFKNVLKVLCVNDVVYYFLDRNKIKNLEQSYQKYPDKFPKIFFNDDYITYKYVEKSKFNKIKYFAFLVKNFIRRSVFVDDTLQNVINGKLIDFDSLTPLKPNHYFRFLMYSLADKMFIDVNTRYNWIKEVRTIHNQDMTKVVYSGNLYKQAEVLYYKNICVVYIDDEVGLKLYLKHAKELPKLKKPGTYIIKDSKVTEIFRPRALMC